jgi:hypothetical protein
MPVEIDARSEVAEDGTLSRTISELRTLIVAAAPDPALAKPALLCGVDTALDSMIPFSSVIVLGVIVAVEDVYGIQVTQQMLAQALRGGATLRTLAQMIEAAR